MARGFCRYSSLDMAIQLHNRHGTPYVIYQCRLSSFPSLVKQGNVRVQVGTQGCFSSEAEKSRGSLISICFKRAVLIQHLPFS